MRSSTEQIQELCTEQLHRDRVGHRRWTAALLAVTILSLVLRVTALGSKSVFADELASFQFAQMSWHDFWQVVARSEANMSLYYVLLRFWIHLGSSVSFLRLLSVIPGVATVPVIFALGEDLFSPAAGLFASLLFALNAFHISYSQAARGYSLAVFLISLSCWLFIRTVREPTTGNCIAYVLVSTAAFYSHFFAAFVLLAQCVAVIFCRPARAVIARQALLMLLVGVLGIPLFLFAAVHKTGQISWAQPVNAKDVYHFFTYLSGSGLKFILSIGALVLAATEYLRTRLSGAHEGTGWPFTFLATWLLLPLLTTLLISIWKPVFSPRFLLICLPAFLLLVGRGLSVIRPAYARYAVAAVFVFSWVTALPSYYREPGIEDWKSAVAYLHQHVQPNDSILLNNPSFSAILDFSFHQSHMEPPTRHIIPGPASENQLSTFDHTFLVLCHPNAFEEANTRDLRAKFVSRGTVQFAGIRIVEFNRDRP